MLFQLENDPIKLTDVCTVDATAMLIIATTARGTTTAAG